jgi:hypothetical protein
MKPKVALTVRQLIEALESCPHEAHVVLVDVKQYGVRPEDSPYVHGVEYSADDRADRDGYVLLLVQGTEVIN